MARPDLLEGLPSLAALQEEKGRSDTFADLRDWVRSCARRGELRAAGHRMGPERRNAAVHFLEEASRAGVRQSRAKELLALLLDPREGFAEEQPDAPGAGAGARRAGAAAAGPEEAGAALAGLPSEAELAGPEADGREAFQELRAWARARRQAGQLEAAAGLLPPARRRAVFRFLLDFAPRRTLFRGHARELLERLARSESWRAGGVLAEAELAAALAAGASAAGAAARDFTPPPCARDKGRSESPSTASSTPRGDGGSTPRPPQAPPADCRRYLCAELEHTQGAAGGWAARTRPGRPEH